MKRLLLYTAYGSLKGNVFTIYDYYCKNLKDKLNSSLDVVYLDVNAISRHKINQKVSFIRRNLALIFPRLIIKGSFDYWVTDSGGNFLSRLARGIEVAHGYGTKQTPAKSEINSFKIKILEKFFLKKLDAFITLSDFDSSYFYNNKDVKHNAQYLSLGLPRNDRLLNRKNNLLLRQKFCKRFELISNAKFILYAPTWREDDFGKIDTYPLNSLNDVLQRENAYLLYRPHHHGEIFSRQQIESLSNIIFLDNSIIEDTQEVLSITDYLITDYSSIFVDYLLLNRPIIFYVFDLDKYKNRRGLVIDYNNDVMTPGKKVFNLEELVEEVKNLLNGEDKFVVAREASRHFFHNELDNKSTERVWEYLLKKLEIEVVVEDTLI